jgi:L-ascorbate metabolism protein UlaG (beta-lactamase superfamily)
MKITKFGHACLLLEEGDARILIDPGVFSEGFETLTGLAAILITHSHADHFVADNLVALLKANASARVYADELSAAELAKDGRLAAEAVYAGDSFEVAGVRVSVEGVDHATIHEDIPTIPNVGYRVGERFFYPGDRFTKPAGPVEILALPLGAPWLKVSEVIDYVLAVAPKVAIPVHDAVLAFPDMHQSITRRFTEPKGIELRVVANGTSTEV